MREPEIRELLRTTELQPALQDAHTRVVEELGLCEGTHRIDVAVVNGVLAGYEIKSERDTLLRLPSQVEAYSRVFDQVTLVTSARHLAGVRALVPRWWGILEVRATDGAAGRLVRRRKSRSNPRVDSSTLVQLLWRDEALSILESEGIARGLRGSPRPRLWEALVEHLPPVRLREVVRDTLRARRDWRVS